LDVKKANSHNKIQFSIVFTLTTCGAYCCERSEQKKNWKCIL